MAHFYADSSALVKRHVLEAGSTWFQALVTSPSNNTITTTRISMVEVYSALNRRIREGSLNPGDYIKIVTDFNALCVTQYTLLELAVPIVARTQLLLEHHPLRAYDAVHLASALVTNDTFVTIGMTALVFLSADQRLLHAAQAEGLATDNPNAYP